jgi:hypothetical protein
MTQRGEAHHRHKLTAAQVRDIRKWLAFGKTGRYLSVWYGVSEQLISKIRTGRVWKHLDRAA